MESKIKKELWRKSVHALGLPLLPVLFWNRKVFSLLFLFFLLLYLMLEETKKRGKVIPFFSNILDECKRENEKNHLAWGAISLSCASFFLPYLFGVSSSGIGLAQIFSADVVACLMGMQFGGKTLPYSKDKTWMGTLSFFLTAVLASAIFVPFPQAIFLGFFGAFLESLPLGDWDNFVVPTGVAWLASILFIG